MSTYEEDIRARYKLMGTEELVERAKSGNLTDSAQEIAVAELAKRGISLDRLPSDLASEMTLREEIAKVRPLVRFWARMLDIYTFSFVGGIVLAIIAPHFLERTNEYALGMILVFVWIFVEAILLSSFQTTPSKWLFKTKVALTSGVPITFSQALARGLKVWWRGLGTGFPIASLITLIVAHGRLTRNGITSWDKDGGFTVTHETIGVLRVFAAVAFFVAFLVLVAIGNSANA